MILYNVTAIVDESIHEDWKVWMQESMLKEVMDSGCFVSYRVLKVLDSPNEGLTYCVQYVAESVEDIERYQSQHARNASVSPGHFQNKFITFSSLMEYVNPNELY